MAKRSLIDKLDQAVAAIIAHPDSPLPPADSSLTMLLPIAADLRDLPSEGFKARLKSDLEKKAAMTTVAVKPIREGFHTITPYLVVVGAGKLIDFLKQTFAAEEMLRAARSDGTIMHAEVRIGDSMVAMADATAEYPPMPGTIHLYVENADAVYRRALQAGATSIYEPMDQPYGDREAGVKDSFGNVWYIATHQGAKPIPEGLRSVTPVLYPRGAERLIDFLQQAFAAEETLRAQAPDGTIAQAKVKIGDSILEIGEAHGQFQPMPCLIQLYVDDADAVYQRALEAGATSLFAPDDKPYGDRMGAVKDPFGNLWTIAMHIKDVPR